MHDSEPIHGLSESERKTWDAFRTVSAFIQNQRENALRKFGLSVSEFEILYCLFKSPTKSERMSELADSVFQSRSRTTHAAKRLENQGFLSREMCNEDRRGISAKLTKKGAELMNRAVLDHDVTIRTSMIQQLSADELSRMQNSLKRIARLS